MARVLLIFLGLLGLTGVLLWVSQVSKGPAAGSETPAALSSGAASEAGATALGLATPLFGPVAVDAKGAAKIAGKANPGDEITLLVNEKAAGVQTASADGAWSFDVQVPPKDGEHILAVTSRNAKGETQVVGDRVKISAPANSGETPEVTLIAQNGSSTVLQKAGETGAPSRGITVEKAETAGEGKVSLAGKGDPGAKVMALIGGEPVGEAMVGADGAWAIEGVAKATGSLRLEMKDADGKDKDRIDLPFTVASAEPAAAAAAKTDADAKAVADAKAKEDADAKAKAEAEAKTAADAKAKDEADAKAKEEADAKAKAEAEAKTSADAKAKEEADAKAKAEADAKTVADAKAKEEADAKAKAEADAKTAADAKAKTEAEEKAKADEIAKATKLAEEAAKKAAAEAAAKVAGAMNPAGDVAGSLSKAVEAVAKATDEPKVRPLAAKRRAVRGSRKVRARAAEREFVYRYVRMTETRLITVQRGDSLHRIAKRKLGDGDRWVEIKRVNGRAIRNPNVIVPGQKLRLHVVTMRKVAVPAKKYRHKKVRRHRGR